MTSYLHRKQRFSDAKNSNLASSFLNMNNTWSRNQQQLMFNTAMEILSRKNANRTYRNRAHDILYILAKPYPHGGYGRLWQLNHPIHMHYRGFPNKNWSSPPRRRPTPPKRQPITHARQSRKGYTLNTFAQAPKNRNTFNTYAREWFGIDYRGAPLTRTMARNFHPNKRPGNKRAEELMKLFIELYK